MKQTKQHAKDAFQHCLSAKGLKSTVQRNIILYAFGDGVTHYEQATEGARHEHLVCTDCGAITEFENEVIKQLQDEVLQSHGFLLNTLKIELRGICSHCLTQSE